MWYTGGMTTANWINLVAALIVGGGTLFLGIMAWRTILQTRSIQKAEKRERLLNEIINWATDVARYGIESDSPDLSDDKDAAKSWPFLANQEKTLNSSQLLGARALSMCIIAEKINPKLKLDVENTSKELENQQGCLWEYKQWGDTRPKNEGVDTEFLRQLAERVAQNNYELYNSTLEVIRDATDLM